MDVCETVLWYGFHPPIGMQSPSYLSSIQMGCPFEHPLQAAAKGLLNGLTKKKKPRSKAAARPKDEATPAS